jgi:23S rRNA U2552 (ribose-2'-O)-methylase RlmE/FtsJ
MDHKFEIFQYPQNTKNIMDGELDTSFGTSPTKPLLSLGFIHFDHQTKNKTEIFGTKLKGKKFYLVTSEFEHIIENYKEDLNYKISKKFKVKNGWLSRAAFKMWEILTLFNLTDKKSGMNMLHLAEAPGSFVQSIISYRDTNSKKSSSDKHYVVSIKDSDKTVPSLDKLSKALTTAQKKKVKLHKYTSSDIGDLTSLTTLQNIVKNNKKKADLITADGGFNWTNENFQEQEAYRLLLAEIIGAIMNQAKGGHFVIKLFETFTESSIKLIEILSQFYKNIFIYKPLTSRSSNSEKYVICESFTLSDEKVIKKHVTKLVKLLEDINKQEVMNNLYLQNFATSYEIPIVTKVFFKYMNTNLMIKQMKQINKMINYINSDNYFGDEYHSYKKHQIDATDFWYTNFIENSKTISYKFVEQIKKNKEDVEKDLKKYIKT